MAVLEIEGRRVEVDDSFKDLSPEQQAATVDEIARSMNIKPSGQVPSNSFMGQVNAGIADTAGGLVDLINPFDKPHALNPFPEGTGSAKTGLRNLMQAGNAAVATDAPQTLGQSFGRGVGEAAAAFAPTMAGLGAVRSVGGAIGGAADDALRALQSKAGFGAELVAGGAAQAGSDTAERMGYGPAVQGLASVAAPLGLYGAVRGAGAALRGGTALAAKTPVTGYAMRLGQDVKRAIVPMTEGGAREVARTRLQDLAGGPERAAELGQRISPNEPFGRTGAEQAGDPNLLGLQRSAADENPLIRERLDARREATGKSIVESVRDMGGDIGDARQFFRQRLDGFKAGLSEMADRAIAGADRRVSAAGPRTSEASNSTRVVDRLKAELTDALEQEGALWAAVPKGEVVPTSNARAAAAALVKDTPRAQQSDIPRVVRQLLIDEDGFGETETVAELHGLYSELRRISRSAMAGSDKNKNLARISNDIADAILEDLGTLDPDSQVGRAVNEARAFSRALHETFDQGAVGRILKRTLDGDEVIAPETALDKTVGRGGTTAQADNQSIRAAASAAGAEITDYLRSRFSENILNASGEFTPKAARTWMRNNAEILSQYGGLKSDLERALSSREAAQAFAIRAAERAKLAEVGPVSDFLRGQPEKAITAILGADNPVKAAGSIAATARKDPSGQALAGVKAAFSDYLTRDAEKLPAFLSDPRTKAAMSRVFSPDEMRRLRQIGDAMASLSVKPRDVGSVMDSPANKMVEMLVRVMAARRGGQLGGGSMGGSLQTANIFVERAQSMLYNLTNDKARQLLMDAVEDPTLMRELLMQPESWVKNMAQRKQSKLTPYLVGAAAAQTEQ